MPDLSESIWASEPEILKEQMQTNWWQHHWKGMPSYVNEDQTPFYSLRLHFKSQAAVDAFAKRNGLTITRKTRSHWIPPAKIGKYVNKVFVQHGYPIPPPLTSFDGKPWFNEDDRTLKPRINPRYPVYIISKGRWETRLTAKSLEWMAVPYHIVVEPQEYDEYAKVIDPKKILTLPFSNLGQGSIPARNWVWDH